MATEPSSTRSLLNGATIGCGFFSRIQMQAWLRVSGARITAVCDLDAAKAKSFAAEFGLRAYADPAEMLAAEKPDFVDIATRPAAHVELVELAAERGLPTLCQKPMAETWEQACRLVQVARAGGIRLMINENWRWQAWYRAIGGLISEGRIGRPFFYQIQTRQRDGVGERPFPNQPYFADMPRLLLIETLVHHIETARYLMGDIEEVYCRTGRLNPRVRAEDFALIMLRHVNGVEGLIDGNRVTEPDEDGPAMETARFEGHGGCLTLRHSGDVFLGGEQVFSGRDVPGYRGDSCRGAQQHFIDCLRSGEPFESEAGDYLEKTFAAVEACYLSAAENRPATVSELTARAEPV